MHLAQAVDFSRQAALFRVHSKDAGRQCGAGAERRIGKRMGLQEESAELPLESVGARLRRAREAAGLSRADIARQTRISERMLAALEDGNYAVLPARTYATGFARSYARAVGLDADAIVSDIRRDLDRATAPLDRAPAPTFEPGDPARVPSRRVAWVAVAALVLVLVGLATWRASTQPVSGLPSILPPDAPASPRPVAPRPAPTPSPAATGPVVLTAEAPAWVHITAAGKDFLKHEMKAGESFTVPADAADPRLRTGRPDALAITIGGKPVPRLADRQTVVADVPISAAALLARAATQPAPLSTATPAPIATPPAHTARRHPRPAATGSPPPQPSPVASTPAPAPAPAAIHAEPSTAAQ
jgi:cytoskeletal protein RodZ